jgi:GntR family transcriptional repressor for pyruvate dehydrogenase complex
LGEDHATLTQQLRSSAVDAMVTEIRGIIAAGGLVVGDSLPTERELCERFSTSRNTVREAMRILKAYGLVEVRPKVGATITDNRMARALELFSFDFPHISRATFADVQGFRVALEVRSVDTIFARATAADVDALRAIDADLLTARSLAEAADADFRFHLKLVSLIGNRVILDVYGMMKPVILQIMASHKTRRAFETGTFREHEAVVDALAARDRIAYQYRLQAHLESNFLRFEAAEAGA